MLSIELPKTHITIFSSYLVYFINFIRCLEYLGEGVGGGWNLTTENLMFNNFSDVVHQFGHV